MTTLSYADELRLGSRGYVVPYRYDALDDAVEVLALRGQRESGFRDR